MSDNDRSLAGWARIIELSGQRPRTVEQEIAGQLEALNRAIGALAGIANTTSGIAQAQALDALDDIRVIMAINER